MKHFVRSLKITTRPNVLLAKKPKTNFTGNQRGALLKLLNDKPYWTAVSFEFNTELFETVLARVSSGSGGN